MKKTKTRRDKRQRNKAFYWIIHQSIQQLELIINKY
jgi:hypothetical protein